MTGKEGFGNSRKARGKERANSSKMKSRWGRGTEVGAGGGGGGEPEGSELERETLGGRVGGGAVGWAARGFGKGRVQEPRRVSQAGGRGGRVSAGGGERTLFSRKGRPGRKLSCGERGGDCCSGSGRWDPQVAVGLLRPTASQGVRARGAGDTAAILFARPAAPLRRAPRPRILPSQLLQARGSAPADPLSSQVHSQVSPIWAREARDPRTRGGGHWIRELEVGGWFASGETIGVGARMGQETEKSDLETGGGRGEWKNTWFAYKGG